MRCHDIVREQGGMYWKVQTDRKKGGDVVIKISKIKYLIKINAILLQEILYIY